MLQEIETLLLQVIKQFMTKPELLVTELHGLYVIYKDLKGLTNGNTQNQS